MKYTKIWLFAAAAFLAFACGKTDYPAYEYGPQDDTTGKVEAFFPITYHKLEIDPTVDEYTIVVARTETTGALSVPVESHDPAGVFDVPSKVEFSDGEATANLVIGLSRMEIETNYTLKITIAVDNVYYYKASSTASTKGVFHLDALKQQWDDAGTCTFYDGTWFSNLVSVENIPIQNHAGTNDYRIVAPYAQIDEDFEPANIIFQFEYDKDHKPVVSFEDGIYDIWAGIGYYMYYNTSSYKAYCYVENDGTVFEVNCLITNDAGNLYTGGYFAFDWTGMPAEGAE